jgi:hypothetical protein
MSFDFHNSITTKCPDMAGIKKGEEDEARDTDITHGGGIDELVHCACVCSG